MNLSVSKSNLVDDDEFSDEETSFAINKWTKWISLFVQLKITIL